MSSPTAIDGATSNPKDSTLSQNQSMIGLQNPMVDDAGIAPANSRLGFLSCLYGRPRLCLALAGVFLAQVMGCLDADTAITLVQVILP